MELDSSIHLVALLEIGLGCTVNNKIATVLNSLAFVSEVEHGLTLLYVWPELMLLDADSAIYLIVR